MKFHSQIETKRDGFGHIQAPNCQPSELRRCVELLCDLGTQMDFDIGSYQTVSELDRKLTLAFWRFFDGMDDKDFDNWYIKKATDPDLISRARRWLVEKKWMFLDANVQTRAIQAQERFSNAIKGRATK